MRAVLLHYLSNDTMTFRRRFYTTSTPPQNVSYVFKKVILTMLMHKHSKLKFVVLAVG